MSPETVLELAAAALRAAPPAGVDADYIDAFIGRHRAALVAAIEAAFAPVPERGEPSKWGGRMGEPIAPAALVKGMRVVCDSGHGVVHEVTAYRWQTITYLGAGRSAAESERHYNVAVRLDSGRLVHYSREYREEIAPGVVIPDLVLRPGDVPVSPSDAWGMVVSAKRSIEAAIEKANNARLPNKRQEWLRAAESQKASLIRLWDAFDQWRSRWPDVPVEGLDPFAYRVVELAQMEARRPDPLIAAERQLLLSAPSSWRTRYAVGDAVSAYVFSDRWELAPGWTVVEVDVGRLAATLTSGAGGSRVVPLWLLRPAEVTRAAFGPGAMVFGLDRTGSPRGAGAEGCIDTTLNVPNYGEVRVVCGQAGRRDVWHNVWVRGTRFGYNGGRWAKNLRPADPVLDAIRGQGITAFG